MKKIFFFIVILLFPCYVFADSSQTDYTVNLNIQNLYDRLEECKIELRQRCYNELREDIGLLNPSLDKDNLLTSLFAIKDKVRENEEKIAYELVEEAENSILGLSYNKAKRQLKNVQDEELVKELSERLIVIEKKLNIYKYIINSIFCVVTILLSIYIYRYYLRLRDKRINGYKEVFDEEYYRELPTVSPIELSYLINDKEIGDNDICSEFLILECEGKINIKKSPTDPDDCIFIRLVDIDDKLNEKDKNLLGFIFGPDNDKEVALSELKDNIFLDCDFYLEKWEKVKKYFDKQIDFKRFFVDKTPLCVYKNVYLVSFLLFLFFILGTWLAFVFAPIFLVYSAFLTAGKTNIYRKSKGKFVLFIAVILCVTFFMTYFLIFSGTFTAFTFFFIHIVLFPLSLFGYEVLVFNPMTHFGKEIYGKAMGLKRFFEDFSNLKESELPEVELREKYLAYAMVLGCSDKVSKTFKYYFGNFDDLIYALRLASLRKHRDYIIANSE